MSTTPPATTKPPRYDFPVTVYESVPTDPPRYKQTSLPFRERWTALVQEIERDGKARGFYVPASYFVEARGADAAKVNHGYLRQKLSDEWGKWVKEAPAAKRGDRFELVKANRTGAEPGFEGQGPGVLTIIKTK